MGWIGKILVSITVFILINWMTGGRLLELILPHAQTYKADILCSVGGLLFNPVAGKVGPVYLIYPSGDDAFFATVMTSALLIFARGKLKETSWKKKILTIVGTWIGIWLLFKLFGYFLTKISGKPVDMCVMEFSIAGLTIPYVIFDPVFYIGFGIAVASLVGLIISLRGK